MINDPPRSLGGQYLFVINLGCVALPEENDPHHGPDCAIFPVLTEDISWVGVTTNMVESCDTGRYGMASLVEGQSVVSLL